MQPTIQLTYRGARYNYEPTPVDMVETNQVGVYRGQAYPITYPRHIPVQPVHNLSYRGVAYQTTATGGTVTAPGKSAKAAAQPVPLAAPSNPRWQTAKTLRTEYETTHRLNIQRRLQQRIEAAKARGDNNLLNLLQDEMQRAS